MFASLVCFLKRARVFQLITQARLSTATFKPIKFIPNSCYDGFPLKPSS